MVLLTPKTHIMMVFKIKKNISEITNIENVDLYFQGKGGGSRVKQKLQMVFLNPKTHIMMVLKNNNKR